MAQTAFRIPALLHSEALSGPMISDCLVFPTSIGLAASFQPELAGDMADRIRQDGRLEQALCDRYASWQTGIGREIREGRATLQQLEEYALQMGEVTTNQSGRQEELENLLNGLLFG